MIEMNGPKYNQNLSGSKLHVNLDSSDSDYEFNDLVGKDLVNNSLQIDQDTTEIEKILSQNWTQINWDETAIKNNSKKKKINE